MSAIRRLEKKSNPKVRNKILSYFPAHTIYLEPFWGGGGLFEHKPRSKYNFLNDLDSDVHNAFICITEKRAELIAYLELVPYHVDTFQYFRKLQPKTDVQRCAKFLILSAWGYMGKTDTLKLTFDNSKNVLLQEIELTCKNLASGENRFTNCDFRYFFKSINFKKPTELNPDRKNDLDSSFAYLDPPYLGTTNNYNTPEWTEADVCDLMDIMKTQGMKMAMSEFDHPFVIEQAEKRGFKIIHLGERQNMKNRRSEILILNYEPQNKLF